tara:strand:+ start:588 stop:1118 length:531 start_codon:yes stop_codon:yes gene_type:complete
MLNKEVQEELNKFAKYVIQQSRSNLTKGDKNASKDLYNSLGYKIDENAKGATLGFEMDSYGDFVDKGVRGKTSSNKAPDSPYRFGTGSGKKGGLTKGINQWVKRKGIQFRDRKSGRYLSYKSTAFLISRSIYQKGIKPSLFFTKPFVAAFKRLPDELLQSYSVGLEKQIGVILNKK